MVASKKIILCGIVFLAATTCWAVDWLALGGSFGTAAVVNKDESFRAATEGLSRVVLELDATAELVLHPNIRIALGSILLTDFKFKGDDRYHSLDYGFYSGLRIYPGLGGLRLGVDYNLGRRTDFIRMAVLEDTYSTRWGNGFRFLLEYDFKSGSTGLAPIIGGSWRHIPRGGSSDHILSIYFKLLYR